MNARTIILSLAGGAVVLLLIRSLQSQPPQSAPASGPAPKVPAPASSPVAAVVEETLHQHEGENSPFVEAFAEALHPEAAHGTPPA